jgi:hypothetical protein
MEFSPQWRAIQREVQLAAEQLAIGTTTLGQANHAQPGLYSQAFFSLSIGFERLAKLIIVADYATTHGGSYPTDRELRKFGHDIAALLKQCEQVSLRHRSGKEHSAPPDSQIHQGIVTGLTEFGRLSRYYNLDFLVGGKAAAFPDPVAAWWNRVGKPILDRHYSAAQRQKDEAIAAECATMMSPSFVLHFAEGGERIEDVTILMQRAIATQVVQKFGRLYTLQIIRWLAFLMSDMAKIVLHRHGLDAFFGLGETLSIFMCDDRYLITRKRLSIYTGC